MNTINKYRDETEDNNCTRLKDCGQNGTIQLCMEKQNNNMIWCYWWRKNVTNTKDKQSGIRGSQKDRTRTG